MAYDAAFGLGDGHEVLARLCATFARCLTGASVSPADFAPIFRPQAQDAGRQSDGDIAARLLGWAAGRNGELSS